MPGTHTGQTVSLARGKSCLSRIRLSVSVRSQPLTSGLVDRSAERYGAPVISKYAARRKNRVAAGAENIGDGVGWGGWGQCTQLKAVPHGRAHSQLWGDEA